MELPPKPETRKRMNLCRSRIQKLQLLLSRSVPLLLEKYNEKLHGVLRSVITKSKSTYSSFVSLKVALR